MQEPLCKFSVISCRGVPQESSWTAIHSRALGRCGSNLRIHLPSRRIGCFFRWPDDPITRLRAQQTDSTSS